MKRIFTILAAVLLTASVFAQAPQKMSYQAVVRDASNNLVTSHAVGMQITILQNTTPVYTETQTSTTNANGLVSLEIGTGTLVSGDFTTIDWANDTYFIKTETDPTGGTAYTITGTSQLLSVPYALHAKTAETVENISIDYADVTNTPDLSNFDQDATNDFDGDYNSLTNAPDLTSYLTSFTEVDGSISNEIQDLQLVGNILTITNNGTATDIDLSAYLDDTDTQLTEAEVDAMADDNGYLTSFTEVDGSISNEIQDLQLVGNILTITNNGTATDIDLSAYLDDTDTQLSDGDIATMGYIKNANDADADATNEIQDLQLVGNTLTITNNGTATDIDLSAYLDDTDTQLSDGDIATMGYIKNANDADADATNEIQDLQLVGNILTITNNGTATDIDLSAYLDNTDTQLSNAEVNAIVSANTDVAANNAKISYPATDATKLAGIAAGAEVNVQSDWNQATTTADDYIKNKPSIPTAADGSETKVTAGTNVTVTGVGTTASPYVVNASGGTTLTIGQSYQGGIIFWLDATGQHGLIAATADQSTGIQWYNGTYRYTGTTGDGLYAGSMNTAMIVATQMADNQTGNFAAKVCADYSVTVGGVTYGDWYLPSKYELNLLYQQRALVGGFASAYYWSSSEIDNYSAWIQVFDDGDQNYTSKVNTHYVRAVRAF